MAKPKTAARKSRAAKAAPKTAAKKMENASGAEVKPEAAVATADQSQATAGDAGIQSSAADPAGPAGASPASAGDAPAEPSDTQDPARQPEAGENGPVFVVTGPKNGRYRSGRKFGPEATVLREDEFKPADGGYQRPGGMRLLAILTDPKLRCKVRYPDGTEEPIEAEEIEALRRHLEGEVSDD